jgi:cellulose synthase/poly-beta-1,6-N-acetylglucosamine synthase-like glycosyltransferase
VSVVMPVLNEERHLEHAVRAIFTQDYPGPMEACLALGPSTDATNDVATRLQADEPRLRTVDNPTGKTPAALNAAIRATQGDIVVRVDGHSVLSPGYITRAVQTLRRTGAANVGGVQKAVGTTPFEEAVAAAMASPFSMGGARFHTGGEGGPVDTVYLGVFAREAIEQVGLFDESLIRNQDYELNIRLREAGYTIWFDPELEVEYRPRPTLRALARQYAEYGAWKRHVLRLHPKSLKIRQIVPPIALIALLASIVLAPLAPITLVAPAIYLASIAAASFTTAPRQALRLAIIFPTIHMSWAWGFLTRRR